MRVKHGKKRYRKRKYLLQYKNNPIEIGSKLIETEMKHYYCYNRVLNHSHSPFAWRIQPATILIQF